MAYPRYRATQQTLIDDFHSQSAFTFERVPYDSFEKEFDDQMRATIKETQSPRILLLLVFSVVASCSREPSRQSTPNIPESILCATVHDLFMAHCSGIESLAVHIGKNAISDIGGGEVYPGFDGREARIHRRLPSPDGEIVAIYNVSAIPVPMGGLWAWNELSVVGLLEREAETNPAVWAACAKILRLENRRKTIPDDQICFKFATVHVTQTAVIANKDNSTWTPACGDSRYRTILSEDLGRVWSSLASGIMLPDPKSAPQTRP